MRIHIVLSAVGIGLLAVTTTACSNGSKPTSAATTSSTESRSAASTSTASTSTMSASATTGSPAAAGATSTSVAGNAVKDVDACTLLSTAKAATLVGAHFTSAKSSMIASGQDQCAYGGTDLTVIVYQPTSGVSWSMLNSVLKDVGAIKNVTGVGDRAMVGAIELDAQAGPRLIAVQGGGGLLTGDYKGAVAVAKAVIARLH